MYRSFNARALGLELPAEATLRLAAAHGFEGVDIVVRDLVDAGADPAEIRARMDDLGLRGGAWPLPVRWRGDEATFREDMARLPRLAEVAAILGLFRTGTWVMPETPASPGDNRSPESHLETVAELHRCRLGAIARVLADHGTSLGLEVIGVRASRMGPGPPFIHRMADLAPLLDHLGVATPNVGVLIDLFHLHAAGESIEAGLAWGIDRVVWVHVADLPSGASGDLAEIQDDNRGLPGEHGAIDARGGLRKLADCGYRGPVTAEPMAGCRSLKGLQPNETAQKVAAALGAIWPEVSTKPEGHPDGGSRC